MGLRKRLLPFAVFLSVLIPSAPAQLVQQGAKLVGSGAVNTNVGINQGYSVDVSADGNTAIVGGWADNGDIGAAWIFGRTSGTWTQQGAKLVGSGAVNGTVGAEQGSAVALSGDGNTAIVGGQNDNNSIGAAWIYTRGAAGGAPWIQQGTKLTGVDAAGTAQQGYSVALSADGNTAIVGGYGDNSAGAAFVFTRSNGNWGQQGKKLVASDAAGNSLVGLSVALSADGNTAILGGPGDNSNSGAAWIFVRSNGVWTQQGSKLIGSGAVSTAEEGWSVALSSDGNTAAIGAPADNSGAGAAWIFTRSNGTWSQQGGKLAGTGANGSITFVFEGASVALSGDGNTLLMGGYGDNSNFGAAWVFTRSNGTWLQQGAKLVPTGATGTSPEFGYSAAFSADGSTAIVGGILDNNNVGAAWVFVQPVATHYAVSAPPSVSVGVPFNFTVTALDVNNNLVTGYAGTVHFTSSDSAAALPANAALTNGTSTFSTTLNTAGTRTITATDTANGALTGNSGAIAVVGTSPTSVGPGAGNATTQVMTFTFTDARGYQDLDIVNVLINNFLDGRQACYLAYSRALNVLYLVNDTGTALLPGLVLNGSGSTSNSQCAVAGAGSFANGSGNTLTLTLNLSFSAAFAGDKVTYMAARDLQGNNSGWQALGTWGVPGATTFPAVGGVNPARGAGLSQTFTFTFTDTKGYQDLGVVNVLVNTFLDGRQACYLAYSRPTGTLYLEKDDGSGLLPGVALSGTGAGPSNSQCSVSLAGSSATGSGNTLTLTLNLSFSAAFDGNRVIYAAARDSTDANNSGWQSVGSWTVQ
ncbi:MAG TPA: FG-GAP repeat protein [Bryobacteraceae bacterium]|nr:FG-GAP repeat protein [Bryobacteraceae bacterium]